MKKRRFNRKILALSIVSLCSTIIFSGAITYAAFNRYHQVNQEVKIDTNFTNYFASGNGSAANPYIISTPNHLRNLSYLVNSGYLIGNFEVKLNNDIDFNQDNKPIMPIGTFHAPFTGRFNGQDHRILNVTVKGIDTQDIGLFGCVSTTGYVANFTLVNPMIESKNNNPGSIDFKTRDGNIIRNAISEEMAKSLTLTPTGAATSYLFTNFSIEYKSNSGPTIAIPDGLEMEIRTSDPSLLKISNKTIGSGETINQIKFDLYVDKNRLQQVGSKYVTADVYLKGLVYDEENKNLRYSEMKLESFKLYIQFNNINDCGIIKDETSSKCYTKTIYPEPKGVPDPNGTRYEYKDHRNYIGVVIGDLQGTAERILVYNPTIKIDGGPFETSNYLIGNLIEDEQGDKISKHVMDSSNFDAPLTYSRIDTSPIGYNNTVDAKTTIGWNTYTFPNVVIDDIYLNPNHPSNLFSKDVKDSIRLFGTNDSGNPINPANQKIKAANGDYLTHYPGQQDAQYRNALSFTDDIDAKIIFYKEPFMYDQTSAAIRVSNGFQFWTSAETVLQEDYDQIWASSEGTYILSISLDYVFIENGYNDNYASNSERPYRESNRLRMFSCRKRPGNNGVNDQGVYMTENYIEVNPGQEDLLDNVGAKNVYIGQWPNQTINPHNEPHGCNYATVNYSEDGTFPLEFQDNEINQMPSENLKNSNFEIKTKNITLTCDLKNDLSYGGYDDRTPLVLLGITSPETSLGYRLDIYGLRVTISDISGTKSKDLLNVDFTAFDNPSIPSKDDWVGSHVKVTASMYDDIEVTHGNPTGLKVNPAVSNGCGTYIISATASPKGTSDISVNITYTAPDYVVNAGLVPKESEVNSGDVTINRM